MTSESNRPTNPVTMRIQPTTGTSTAPFEPPVTANARIAPTAITSRLIGIPIPWGFPRGREAKRRGNALLACAVVALVALTAATGAAAKQGAQAHLLGSL